MAKPYRLLLAEDSDDDAELIELALRDGELAVQIDRVVDEAGFVQGLERDPDLIISDYVMPQFDAPRAVSLAKQMRPRTPLILVSRAVDERTAQATMREGVADYLLKDRLTRLPEAVTKALHQCRLEAENRHYREELHRRRNVDPLTGLPNRTLGRELLGQAVARGARLAVARLDLDHLERINLAHGGDVGDEVLRCVGGLLCTELPRASVARFGGDSFLLLIPEVDDQAEVEALLEQVRQKIAYPMRIGEAEVAVTSSIGATLYPRDAGNAESLEHLAGMAVAQAKLFGGNAVRLADTRLQSNLKVDLRLQSQLRQAVAEQQFELRFQPIIDTRSTQWVAAEALIYWKHGRRGLLPRHTFMPGAESAGLAPVIQCWALSRACAALRAWQPHLPETFRLSLRLSPATLLRRGFVDSLQQCLAESGVRPQLLEIETRTCTMDATDADFIAALDKVRHTGVQLALGETGHAPCRLAQLAQLPIDRIKLDRTVVCGLVDSPELRAVAAAVAALAAELGLASVAEGVERQEQVAAALKLGFDEVQGELLAASLDGDIFLDGYRHGRR